MSNKQTIEISDALGISPTTVKRALNHCPGVGSELRQQILDTESALFPGKKETSVYDAYVILPEIPAYFWGQLFELLLLELSRRNIRTKYNIYSKLTDRNIVGKYLDEAEALGVRCIIVAAADIGIAARLASLAQGRAVFTVCSRISVSNVFYFGSDHFRDGQLLGEKCLALFPQARCIALVGEDAERKRGVLAALGERECIHIPCAYADSAADLARRLYAAVQGKQLDAVIGLDGISAKIGIAMKKCRITAPTFGVEHQEIEARYPSPRAAVCQDLGEIARCTAEACERFVTAQVYPSHKEHFIPSYIRE